MTKRLVRSPIPVGKDGILAPGDYVDDAWFSPAELQRLIRCGALAGEPLDESKPEVDPL